MKTKNYNIGKRSLNMTMKLLCAAFLISHFSFLISSCSDMDDNYKEYLENIPTYSPPVRNLTAVSPEAGTLTLKWTIDDKSQRAKSIRILVKKTTTDVKTYDVSELVMEYTVSGLELQAYDFDVYTIDGFGNLSIPVSKTFTPIPGRE